MNPHKKKIAIKLDSGLCKEILWKKHVRLFPFHVSFNSEEYQGGTTSL